MDKDLITKDGTFFSMVKLSDQKLKVCKDVLGLSLRENFFGKTIWSSGGVATSSKGRIPRAPKRKKSNKKVAKRPRTASNVE